MAEDDSPSQKAHVDSNTFYAAVAEYYHRKSDYTSAYVRFIKGNNASEEGNSSGINKLDSAATSFNMPTHPKDKDNVSSGEAAKSQDHGSGTASAGDHEARKATIEEHKANPGPVMVENLPEPKSKEQLKKEAEQLNK